MSTRDAEHPENRLTGPIDGALHLLDRQLLDIDGEMLGKVDDVELTQLESGLAITGLLSGWAALLPRLGGSLGRTVTERWAQLRPAEPLRTRPWRIDLDDVDRLDSAVHLGVRRDGVLRRDREGHRLGDLTAMRVVDPDGRRAGRVLDARFEPADDGHLVLCSLIVGRGRPGSLLGYDRRRDQGPLPVRSVVRWLHRHSAIVAAEDAEISWPARVVHLKRRPDQRPDHPFEQADGVRE